ncbi:MAG: hypothetical protein BMS9Abin15_1120 [Gammaproteobacteria bacterium]|nr:MAG: hypothetical protein BMS9Abin15_1120 [Gammaproteobacteria bacterium]
MPEGVAGDAFGDPGFTHSITDCFLQAGFMYVVTPYLL